MSLDGGRTGFKSATRSSLLAENTVILRTSVLVTKQTPWKIKYLHIVNKQILDWFVLDLYILQNSNAAIATVLIPSCTLSVNHCVPILAFLLTNCVEVKLKAFHLFTARFFMRLYYSTKQRNSFSFVFVFQPFWSISPWGKNTIFYKRIWCHAGVIIAFKLKILLMTFKARSGKLRTSLRAIFFVNIVPRYNLSPFILSW